jgi:hypothetical protein
VRIAVLTALWQRRELSRLMLRHLAQQQERLAKYVTLSIHCAVSDEAGLENAERVGAWYCQVDNHPLGAKYNAGLAEVRQHDPCDAVCVLGSDNFVTDALWLKWAEVLDAGVDYAGVLDAYKYDLATQALSYWPGYDELRRVGEPMGSGRLYSRRLLDEVDWHLWDSNLDRGLDWSVTQRLEGMDIEVYTNNLASLGAVQIGVKDDIAICGYQQYVARQWRRITWLEAEKLEEWFGDIGREIRAL